MLLTGSAGRPDPCVVLVCGKGGVGKTSVASAYAVARARAGARVLVASTDPAHNLGHLWDAVVGDEPTPLAAVGHGAVDGLEIDPYATVDRHLAAVRRTMRRLLPERLHGQVDRHLDLAREAPGTHESAVLERIAQAVQEGLETYDVVVFDTAPTGHTVRLMALPEQLTAWSEGLLANRDRSDRFAAALGGLGGDAGPAAGSVDGREAHLRDVLTRRRDRFAHLRDVVRDPDRAAFVLVLTAERLPVLETVDLHRQLTALDLPVGGLVVNRRSPADAGALLAERRVVEDRHLAALRSQLAGVPLAELPLVAGDLVGIERIGELADLLSAG